MDQEPPLQNAFVGAAGSETAPTNVFLGAAGSKTAPTNHPVYIYEGARVLSSFGRSLLLRRRQAAPPTPARAPSPPTPARATSPHPCAPSPPPRACSFPTPTRLLLPALGFLTPPPTPARSPVVGPARGVSPVQDSPCGEFPLCRSPTPGPATALFREVVDGRLQPVRVAGTSSPASTSPRHISICWRS